MNDDELKKVTIVIIILDRCLSTNGKWACTVYNLTLDGDDLLTAVVAKKLCKGS